MTLITSLKRSAIIASVFAYHLTVFQVNRHASKFAVLRRWRRTVPLTGPQRLRLALEQLGGAFIKFGQVLALQSDLLPLDYCQELFNLLDRVPPFPFVDVEHTFRKELGNLPRDIFDTFDPRPIATGSIGQVHLATLGNSKLAVKIRRPTVLIDFGADIQLMAFIVRIVTVLRLTLLNWIVAPTSEFIAWTKEELDYRNEARYMDAIAKNARGNLSEQVPQVFWQYTTECILTTEFFEARTVLDYMRARENGDEATLHEIRATGFAPHTFARNLIDNFLGDAFRHGLFHADLHPANLMIMPCSCVGYIDFGIAGLLSAYSRQRLITMTLAYTRGDLDGMCECFFHVSAMEENANPHEFRRRLSRISREWYSSGGEHLRLRKSITAMMLDLLMLSRATGIWPQRDVVKYIRSAIALDGLIKSFAPGFDVGEHLESACDRYLQWNSLGALLLPKTMFALMRASTRLGSNGITRLVCQLSAYTNDRQQDWKQYGHSSVSRTSRLLRYSAVALICAVSFNLFEKRFSVGLNIESSMLMILLLSVFLAIKRFGLLRISRDDTS